MLKWIRKITGNLTIDDLPSQLPSIKEMRAKAQILIIDDQPLTHENALRAMGFQFTVYTQWNNISDVERYQIIITDNNGVANNLGVNCDGISMVCQAELLYPEKRYAVYSADLIDSRGRLPHHFPILTKGDTADDWAEILDDAILDSYDPKKAWKIIVNKLDKNDVSEREKRAIQHSYVKAVLNKSTKEIENASWGIDKETLSLIVRIASLGVSTMRLLSSL